jgi:hypothetical protein
METRLILDGQEVSKEILQEKMNNPNCKVVKIEENVYKTLQKLKG